MSTKSNTDTNSTINPTSTDPTCIDPTTTYYKSIETTSIPPHKKLISRAGKTHNRIMLSTCIKQGINYWEKLNSNNPSIQLNKTDDSIINMLNHGHRSLNKESNYGKSDYRKCFTEERLTGYSHWFERMDWSEEQSMNYLNDLKFICKSPGTGSSFNELLSKLPNGMIYGKKIYDDLIENIEHTVREGDRVYNKCETTLKEIENDMSKRYKDSIIAYRERRRNKEEKSKDSTSKVSGADETIGDGNVYS